jgi:hypothetical protein
MAADRSVFDRAEYTSASTGLLGKAVPPGFIVNVGNNVRIDDGHVCWSIEPLDRIRFISPKPEMFDSFLGLWDSPDSAIVRFAKKWAPLRVNDDFSPSLMTGREPLQLWRFLSRRVYSVVQISAKLDSGETPADADWYDLSSDLISITASDSPTHFYTFPDWSLREPLPDKSGVSWDRRLNASRQKDIIAAEIDEVWLEKFPSRPTLSYGDDNAFEIQMRFSYGNLLPFIALQMALTVAGVNRFFSCSACGKLYVRKEQRTPNKGQSNYCSAEACKKEALRRADQNRRMRVIRVRELHVSGVSVSEIAAQLGISIKRVRALLERASNGKKTRSK